MIVARGIREVVLALILMHPRSFEEAVRVVGTQWLSHTAGMPVLDEKDCEDRLETALASAENAHVIDLYDALLPHKDEQLYYRDA